MVTKWLLQLQPSHLIPDREKDQREEQNCPPALENILSISSIQWFLTVFYLSQGHQCLQGRQRSAAFQLGMWEPPVRGKKGRQLAACTSSSDALFCHSYPGFLDFLLVSALLPPTPNTPGLTGQSGPFAEVCKCEHVPCACASQAKLPPLSLPHPLFPLSFD